MTLHSPAEHEPASPASHRRKRRRGLMMAAAGAGTVLAIALVYVGVRYEGSGRPGAAAPSPTAPAETRLQSAKRECAPGDTYVTLGDSGTSMVISGVAAEETLGASLTELACLLDELDVPDAVVSHMETTRALDGRQEASWAGFTASWTYHPDDGLDVILQEAH